MPHWIVHVAAVGVLFWFQSLWLSLVAVLPAHGLPGVELESVAGFHRTSRAVDSQERTASVESNVIFGLLYLHNNLHVAHHLKPATPWYEIPRYYRDHRRELLALNGDFVYPGYAVLARQYFLIPVFSPVHPTL